MAFVLTTAAPGNSSLTHSQQGPALTAGHCGVVDLAEKNDLHDDDLKVTSGS